MSDFNIDPNRPIEEILGDIKKASVQTMSAQRGDFVGAILSPFAALLVRLSRDAKKSADKLEILTARLYRLTIFLLILTALLFVREIAKDALEIYKNVNFKSQSSNKTEQKEDIERPIPGQGPRH